MSSEQHDETTQNKVNEAASVGSEIADFGVGTPLHAQLTEKLKEYAELTQEIAYKPPEQVYFQYGIDSHLIQYKELILRTILELVEDTERDFDAHPITIGEVGTIIMADHPAHDITPALEIPFVWVEHDRFHEPDYERLAREVELPAYSFANAYGIIMAYTNGRADLLRGGRGLPEVESVEH